jgi:arylsulfatase A-like enzyme
MNVVLVIIDSLRNDHVGAYGNDWIQTPNLDALSERTAV